MSRSTSQPRAMFPSVRTSRALAVVLVALQALVLVGLALVWLASLVRGTAFYPAGVTGLAVVALVAAALLAACARGVRGAKAWTRAPVITFQLLLGIMGIEWLRGGAPLVGGLAVVVTVVVTALMLRPGVVALRGPRPEAD